MMCMRRSGQVVIGSEAGQLMCLSVQVVHRRSASVVVMVEPEPDSDESGDDSEEAVVTERELITA